MDSLDRIAQIRILPVVTIHDVADSDPLAEALCAGGLPVVEVTLRTTLAFKAIRRMAANQSILVGAGTVLRAEQVDQAVEAGARFIISPGLSQSVVRRARELDVPVVPGVATPTEVMEALDLGLTTVKFFPAEVLGGVKAMASIAAPFGQLRFIPTGGIEGRHLPAYLAEPSVLAVGGSWIASSSLIRARDYLEITRNARWVVAAANQSRQELT